MKNYLRLNLSLLYWIFIAPFTGQFFKVAPIFRQMVFIGVRAAPMVALTAFSVGVTLAMQAAHYKVNAAKVLREVREERLAKSSKPKPKSILRAARKPKPKGSGG